MKLIIEADGTRRLVNSSFKLYGEIEDLTLIRDAVNRAIEANLAVGWVEIGTQAQPPDETLYPYAATSEEQPTYPWRKKV